MNSFYKIKINKIIIPYNPSGDPSGGPIPNETAFPVELVSPRSRNRPSDNDEDESNPPPSRARRRPRQRSPPRAARA